MLFFIKMKKLHFIIALILFAGIANAQQNEKHLLVRISYTDSLINEFENSIYESFYNPVFWSKTPNPTFTVLKIDIDKEGKVKDVRFSDSADTLFVNAFLRRPKYHDDTATLKKYAKAKEYKDISILIPVSYEPFYSPQHNFNYSNLELLMKFDKKDFTGKAIMLAPIQIKVLSEHNM